MTLLASASPQRDIAEGQWEVPTHWAWACLGDVANVLDSRRVPINAKEREQRCTGKSKAELFPYFGATGQVGWIDGYLFEGEHILLGEDGAPFLDRTKDKAYLATGRFWVNNHAHILTPRPGVEHAWLRHALNWIDYEEYVGGTTRLKLTQADLLKLPVPIAPTEEQRRIVARTDELFAEIAEGEAALERARRDLDTWRRALLKAAVTGELTRTRHLEGATELGADLPAGWAAVPAQRLFQWSSGDFLPTKKMRNGNVPVFGGNGINGYHDVAMVGPGTIVVGRVGFYCGSVHLTSEPAWITDNAIFAAKMPDGSVPEYLKIALESCGLRQLAQGGAQPFINQKILNSVVLPIPPVSEQQQITRIMDTWGAAHQGLLDQIQRLEHDRVVLRQSILKAAFAGALAPQDARDEPASVLLERLTHTGRPPAIIARRGRPRSERARA